MSEHCWSTIGVRGDRSCAELEQQVHCRNCPVYAAAGSALLEAAASDEDRSRWTAHVAGREQVEEPSTHAVVIFSLGGEWLAIPTAIVSEVRAVPPIHSLPHRSRGVVFGVANVRGELVACASLRRIFGLSDDSAGDTDLTGCRRVVVIQIADLRFACPVDDVHGIHRFPEGHVRRLPSTLEKASTRFSRGLLSWRDRSVGLIDEDALSQALRRSLT